MQSRKELENELESLNTMLNVVETYQEIAALRMRKIRSTVLKTREYLDGLSGILQQARISYDDRGKLHIEKHSKKSSVDVDEKQGPQEVAVFLSANTTLYGDVIRNIFELFINDIKDRDVDIAIVGKVGLRYYRSSKINKSYQYFEIPDGLLDVELLKGIVKYVTKYQKVSVFYSRFRDILIQEPTKHYITGDLEQYDELSLDVESEDIVPGDAVLYEPSLDDVIDFFKNEILASIFEQTVLEANLSKYAARMISMDIAVENTKKKIKEVDFNRQRVKHLTFNKKQLSSLSSVSLWSSK